MRRTRLASLLLALVSVLVTYLVLELVFFRLALPYLPLNVHTHLPEPARALVQTSKAGYLPHDYIALIGDSYAEGIGDWLLEVRGDKTKPHHSAHIIHGITGRDVVSFGRGPGGSAQGLVLRPTLGLGLDSCIVTPALEQPREFVHYFFEGNDIEDNLAFLTEVIGDYGNATAQSISKYLVESYGRAADWRCHRQFADMFGRMARFLYRRHVLGYDIYARGGGSQNGPLLTFAGGTVRAPPLIGPAIGVSFERIETALQVFDLSAEWTRNRWPAIPVTVVYVPSPLSVYRSVIAAPLGHVPQGRDRAAVEDPQGLSAAVMVDGTSDPICAGIRARSLARGIGFIDARPALRGAAATRPLHGPIDWTHLNEAGYRVLGELVAKRLAAGRSADACQ